MGSAQLQGGFTLRGDKSLSHRAIVFASLVEGTSRIRNLSRGDDVAFTRHVYESLGVEFRDTGDELLVSSKGFRSLTAHRTLLYCGNSGTTLRLSMGVLAGSRTECILLGDSSLNRRPVNRVITPLNEMGGDLRALDSCDAPPVILKGRPLHGINYVSPVASAQVKSAVLLAGLFAEGETRFTEPTLSRNHTESFLASQGIDIETTGTTAHLKPGRQLVPFDCEVPGDISTAAFFVVAALLTRNSQIQIRNVLLSETRIGAIEILKAMGGKIKVKNIRIKHGEPTGDLIVSGSQLSGIDTKNIPAARYIDEVPILSVAAMFASGATVFHEIGELRVKESDRARGIVEMIRCYGGRAAIYGNDLIIEGGCLEAATPPQHHNDHRLALAIEIINLVGDGKISGQYRDVTSISAPEFYDLLEKIRR